MTTDLHLPKIPNFEWVIFNRENHTYTDFLTGKELISVSRVRDSFKTPFDAAKWAPLKAQERGITTADILQEWEAKKTAATERGNLVHDYIGDVLTAAYTTDLQGVLAHEPELPEQRAWRDWYQRSTGTVAPLIKPYALAVEVIIGDRELGIAGTVDAVFTDTDGTILQLWDWKTGSQFETMSKWSRYLLPPFNYLDECELSTYTLQVALYTLILRRAGIKIEEANILHLGKQGVSGTFRRHRVGGTDFEEIVTILERHLLERQAKGLPIV